MPPGSSSRLAGALPPQPSAPALPARHKSTCQVLGRLALRGHELAVRHLLGRLPQVLGGGAFALRDAHPCTNAERTQGLAPTAPTGARVRRSAGGPLLLHGQHWTAAPQAPPCTSHACLPASPASLLLHSTTPSYPLLRWRCGTHAAGSAGSPSPASPAWAPGGCPAAAASLPPRFRSSPSRVDRWAGARGPGPSAERVWRGARSLTAVQIGLGVPRVPGRGRDTL